MEYRRFFRVPVRFDAGSTSMILSSLDAARPMLGADEALSSIVRRRLDKALAERDQHDIAFFLQYSEPAAFHRAFRRRTGRSAGDFQAVAVGEPVHSDVPSAGSWGPMC